MPAGICSSDTGLAWRCRPTPAPPGASGHASRFRPGCRSHRRSDFRVEKTKPQGHGCSGAGAGTGVDHQHYRRLQELGQVGGNCPPYRSRWLRQTSPSRPQSPPRLTQRRPGESLHAPAGAHKPGVKVAARPSDGPMVTLGIDAVRAGLEPLNGQASPGEGPHQSCRDSGLAGAALDACNDDSGGQPGPQDLAAWSVHRNQTPRTRMIRWPRAGCRSTTASTPKTARSRPGVSTSAGSPAATARPPSSSSSSSQYLAASVRS